MRTYNSDTSKVDRKTVERNRRTHMKGLCFELASLIPKSHSFFKDTSSQHDRLGHAAFYIKELKEQVEALKRKKQVLVRSSSSTPVRSSVSPNGVTLPFLELRDMGSTLEVILISNLNKNFMFYQVLAVLQEEGADVVNASFSTLGDKVYHTIHSQVTSSRLGIESSRLFKRLKELVEGKTSP